MLMAMYLLMAVIVAQHDWLKKHRIFQGIIVLGIIATFVYGVFSVGAQATHRMGAVGDYVSKNYQPGDAIISGELYTYFDFSYYNQTSQPTLLLSKDRLSGYGETSLLYDRQDELVVHSLNDVTAKRVWLVGKTGEHDYYKNTPSSWQPVQRLEAGDSVVQLYTLSSVE